MGFDTMFGHCWRAAEATPKRLEANGEDDEQGRWSRMSVCWSGIADSRGLRRMVLKVKTTTFANWGWSSSVTQWQSHDSQTDMLVIWRNSHVVSYDVMDAVVEWYCLDICRGQTNWRYKWFHQQISKHFQIIQNLWIYLRIVVNSLVLCHQKRPKLHCFDCKTDGAAAGIWGTVVQWGLSNRPVWIKDWSSDGSGHYATILLYVTENKLEQYLQQYLIELQLYWKIIWSWNENFESNLQMKRSEWADPWFLHVFGT